ncbi:alpha/beta hydrolase [Acidisphaera sp. L21]|uniref:alpha/beta hydrolase n=1 Tax=Acidisphaera sp. L21 TaxID=1641851 RepID=UPI0020B171CF|nr:alpha/beta hydrolase [Acidisphaera sp. L21]
MSDPIWEYMTGQRRESHPALLAEFARRSAAVTGYERDLRYGRHERCRFDFFPAAPGAPVIAYFHAGYWQGRDKADFLFLAAPFVQRGFAWAAVNYPLCPDVSFDTLMAATHDAARTIRDRAGGRLIVAGHSAGGHIAAELGMAGVADAVVGLSGVYDLAPLLATPLNDALGLDAASAQRHSPVHRVVAPVPPAYFIVGGDETAGFQAQNATMAAAWPGAMPIIVTGADHFTVLEHLANPASPAFAAVAGLAAHA